MDQDDHNGGKRECSCGASVEHRSGGKGTVDGEGRSVHVWRCSRRTRSGGICLYGDPSGNEDRETRSNDRYIHDNDNDNDNVSNNASPSGTDAFP